jgi:diguanylate cyclase (GGDEF)-like protein
LNNHTRGSDIVARYGGEEFVSVLPGATLEDTRLRAEELRQGVKELNFQFSGCLELSAVA